LFCFLQWVKPTSEIHSQYARSNSCIICIKVDMNCNVFCYFELKTKQKCDKKCIITSFQFPCVEFVPWILRGHSKWAKLHYCYILCTLLCLGMASPFSFTSYTMSWSSKVIILLTFVAFKVFKFFFTRQISKPQLHLTIIHISQFLYQTPSYWHKLIQ